MYKKPIWLSVAVNPMKNKETTYQKGKFLSHLPFFLFLSLFLIQGCSLFKGNDARTPVERVAEIQNNSNNLILSTDKFLLPNIPESLRAEEISPFLSSEPLPYMLDIKVQGHEEIATLVAQQSVLLALQEKIPTDRLSLDNRMREDEEIAKKILHSQGYYSGTVHSEVNFDVRPIEIILSINPKERYTLSRADIFYPEEYTINPSVIDEQEESRERNIWKKFPKNLFFFGLEENSEAEAGAIIAAQDKIVPWFNKRGYPFVAIEKTKYYALTDTEEFEAEVYVDPKDFTLFGELKTIGSDKLSLDYINKIKRWDINDVWDERKVLLLEEELHSLGIFSFVDIQPSDTPDEEGQREVEIQLKDGFPRSWGGGFNYDTTRGIGGSLFWEHRNLFGAAEHFKADLAIWTDTQEIRGTFIKPDVLRRDHDFSSVFLFKSEKTDAYDTTSARLDVGFSQDLTFTRSKKLRLSYYLQGEAGKEKDSGTTDKRDYIYGGVPLQLVYRDIQDIFNPSSGYSFNLKVAPYVGEYKKDFAILWAEASFTNYIELLKDKKLIAAFRVKAGSLYSQDVEDIPSSLRFYAGGANSVRGYSYQSIGPENSYGDPLGGSSLFEASFELRYKISENIAIVPFLDMGNVYSSGTLQFPLDLKYGTGIGLRYFTPIGPLRLDVAVPFSLTETPSEKDVQVYVSIGQSF